MPLPQAVAFLFFQNNNSRLDSIRSLCYNKSENMASLVPFPFFENKQEDFSVFPPL